MTRKTPSSPDQTPKLGDKSTVAVTAFLSYRRQKSSDKRKRDVDEEQRDPCNTKRLSQMV